MRLKSSISPGSCEEPFTVSMPSSDSARRMFSSPKDSRTSSVIGARPFMYTLSTMKKSTMNTPGITISEG